ncbi:MAG: ABC transporter ATP-binding protein [Candidatus Rokubacteria bacterium]|nr:ABC transporter ATP-binding protein [Candidatus Rokubacteria bacterium]
MALGGDAVTEKIRVRVTQRFGDLLVLDGIDFSVRENEFLCILGKSGCGKTTLANLMAGLMPCSQGAVSIDGVPVDPKHHELAFVFQEPSCWPWRNVRDNIRIGMEIRGHPAAEIDRRVTEMIDMVGLRGFEGYYPYQISGGMKQRVAIARAFAVDADLILMDEPFAALDTQTRQGMQEEVLRIWEKRKTTVVFITHSLEEAIYLAERIIVLTDKPGTIRGDFAVDLPRPRDFAHPGFIALRKRLGELIGSW